MSNRHESHDAMKKVCQKVYTYKVIHVSKQKLIIYSFDIYNYSDILESGFLKVMNSGKSEFTSNYLSKL